MGKKCVIMGNGPSLNKINIKDLNDIDTFSVNGSFESYEEWGFTPTYHVFIDGNSIRTLEKEIINLVKTNKDIKHFFYNNSKNEFSFNEIEKDKRVSILTGFKGHNMNNNYKGKWELNTIPPKIDTLSMFPSVVPFSIQIAIHLGYDEIGLVGVDVRYIKRKDVKVVGKYNKGPLKGKNKVIFTSDNDPNHYKKNYHGKNHITSEAHLKGIVGNNLAPYKTMEDFSKKIGVKIYSCTEGSRANSIYEYIPLDSFLKK